MKPLTLIYLICLILTPFSSSFAESETRPKILVLYESQSEKDLFKKLLLGKNSNPNVTDQPDSHLIFIDSTIFYDPQTAVKASNQWRKAILKAAEKNYTLRQLDQYENIFDIPKIVSFLKEHQIDYVLAGAHTSVLSIAQMKYNGQINYPVKCIWYGQQNMKVLSAVAPWFDRIILKNQQRAEYQKINSLPGFKNKLIFVNDIDPILTNLYKILTQSSALNPSYKLLQSTPKIGLIPSAHDSFYQRVQLIRNSYGGEIYFGTFIFYTDKTSLILIKELLLAAQKNTKIHLILDGFGAGEAATNHKSLINLLVSGGVEVSIYHPRTSPTKLLYRNHNKILTNGSMAIIGDRNIKNLYFDLQGKNELKFESLDALVSGLPAWDAFVYNQHLIDSNEVLTIDQDLSIKVKAQEANWLKKVNDAHREYLASTANKVFNPVQLIEAKSIITVRDPITFPKQTQKRAGHHQIIELFDSAKTEIQIINAYLVLTEEFQAALTRAIQRGVKVKAITNGLATNDTYWLSLGINIEKQLCLNMGIELWEYKGPQTLHHKIAVVDQKFSYFGSFNLDPRSQNLNIEYGVIVESENFAQNLMAEFEKITNNSQKTQIPAVPKTLSWEYCKDLKNRILFKMIRWAL